MFDAPIFLVSVATLHHVEAAGNPLLTELGVDPVGGNLEGKDLRFGQAGAALFAVATTGTGTGAANATFNSLMPIGGLVPMVNLLMGCIAPGGVGTGLYSILLLAIIAVFVAGLMVGRTPEYLGKKIEAREMKLAMRCLRQLQRGTAWIQGNHLRLRFDRGQQRLGSIQQPASSCFWDALAASRQSWPLPARSPRREKRRRRWARFRRTDHCSSSC